MYIKDLLNRKDLKLEIKPINPVGVYKYKDIQNENLKISSYYYNLSELYSVLYSNKKLSLREEKFHGGYHYIRFNFDEDKLEVSDKTKLEYSIKICI